MMNRRSFLGTLAGSGVLIVAAPERATDGREVPGWVIEWSGWREPVNQFIKVGFWHARRDPMPETLPGNEYPYYYSTTLGVVAGARMAYALDLSRHDQATPLMAHDDPKKFEAAKAWARKRLIGTLETM